LTYLTTNVKRKRRTNRRLRKLQNLRKSNQLKNKLRRTNLNKQLKNRPKKRRLSKLSSQSKHQHHLPQLLFKRTRRVIMKKQAPFRKHIPTIMRIS